MATDCIWSIWHGEINPRKSFRIGLKWQISRRLYLCLWRSQDLVLVGNGTNRNSLFPSKVKTYSSCVKYAWYLHLKSNSRNVLFPSLNLSEAWGTTSGAAPQMPKSQRTKDRTRPTIFPVSGAGDADEAHGQWSTWALTRFKTWYAERSKNCWQFL